MNKITAAFLSLTSIIFFCGFPESHSQTVLPNASFEDWTTISNYTNPTGWDTPNQELMAIPFFGFSVVTKSTDHYGTGSFSAKLETKHLNFPPTDIPGFMTCGNITVDITLGTYVITGGVPVYDKPTHLKGFYKFQPKGGDSCAIGIVMTKSTGGVSDTAAYGGFSTKDTVPDWTPFSAWIEYVIPDQPDTMNVMVISSALEIPTPGTVLFVDELELDYSTLVNPNDPSAGIEIYQDRETSRILLFFDFTEGQQTMVNLYNMVGKKTASAVPGKITKSTEIINYQNFDSGIYILEIIHNGQRYVKKFYLNPRS